MMESNEYYHLLVENEVYLRALQRQNVPVVTLGFQELQLPGGKKNKLQSPSTLKAVVPVEAQAFFLDRVEEALKYSTVRTQDDEKKKSKSAATRLLSSKSGGIEINVQEILKHHVKKVDNTSYLNKVPTTPVMPQAGRPTKRMQEEMEEAKKFARLKEKEEEKRKRLSKKMDVTDGPQYVYDMRGYKITTEEFEKQQKKQQEQEERAKKHEADQKEAEKAASRKSVFKGAIVEKTSRYVEGLREKAEQVSVHGVCLFLTFLYIFIFVCCK
jgi:Fe2+ transport system protein B